MADEQTARWAKVIETSDAFFYIEVTSIMKNERIRSVWEMVDMKQADPDGTRSIMMLVVYDMTAPRHQILSLKKYAGQMLGGELLSDEKNNSDEWRALKPGTAAEAISRIVAKFN
jgi:hypothetical protein